MEIAGEAARIMLADPDVAWGLVVLTSMPFFARRARLIGEAALAADKPVMIALTPGPAADAPRQALREIGQFYFDRFEDAVRVPGLMAAHDALAATPPASPARPAGVPAASALAVLPEGPLAHGEAHQLLELYGLEFPPEWQVSTPETAADAAASLGFPVALKALSRGIVHKSDVGGVRLDLGSREAVVAAAREMAEALPRSAPAARATARSLSTPAASSGPRRSLPHEVSPWRHGHGRPSLAGRQPGLAAVGASHRAQRRPRRARSHDQPRLRRPPRLRRLLRQAVRRHARSEDRPPARHRLPVGARAPATAARAAARREVPPRGPGRRRGSALLRRAPSLQAGLLPHVGHRPD